MPTTSQLPPLLGASSNKRVNIGDVGDVAVGVAAGMALYVAAGMYSSIVA